MHGLLARAALPIHRRRRRRHREPRGEPRIASDVEALLAGLADAAEDHVVDLAGLDAGPSDHLFQDQGPEDDRMDVLELSVATTDRCTDGLDDDCFTHSSKVPPLTTPTSLCQATEICLAVRCFSLLTCSWAPVNFRVAP